MSKRIGDMTLEELAILLAPLMRVYCKEFCWPVDANGDPAPLTSTSWDGDAKTTANNGTIDLSAVFGVPAGVRAVLVMLTVQDATDGIYVQLGPTSALLDGATGGTVFATTDHGAYVGDFGVVPCDHNGDIAYKTSGDCDYNRITIWAYAQN